MHSSDRALNFGGDRTHGCAGRTEFADIRVSYSVVDSAGWAGLPVQTLGHSDTDPSIFVRGVIL
jgi:hypothetical protein